MMTIIDCQLALPLASAAGFFCFAKLWESVVAAGLKVLHFSIPHGSSEYGYYTQALGIKYEVCFSSSSCTFSETSPPRGSGKGEEYSL